MTKTRIGMLWVATTVLGLLAAAAYAGQEAPRGALDPLTLVRPAEGSRGPGFLTIIVGKTPVDHLALAFGAPTTRDGPLHVWDATAPCKRYGLAAVAARRDAQGVVERMELMLAEPKALDTVVGSLALGKSSGGRREGLSLVHSFGATGIELVLVGERVRTVRLMAPERPAAAPRAERPAARPEPGREGEKGRALRTAVARGDREAARRLVEQGADVQAEDAEGRSALALAIEREDKEMAKILLRPLVAAALAKAEKGGAAPAERPALGPGEQQHLADVQRRLASGERPDLNAELRAAARQGHCRVAELLLEKGADPNAADTATGTTPLHLAAEHGHEAVAELLALSGAPLDAKDRQGRSPLDLARQRGTPKLVTALRSAAFFGGVMRRAVEKMAERMPRTEEEAKVLGELQRRLDQGEKLDLGRVLVGCAQEGHVVVADLVLRKGASPSAQDRAGFTALYVAAAKGHREVVELLLKHGADAKRQCGKKRHTALHDAALRGHLDVARVLVAAGADVNAGTTERATPLHLAAQNGHTDMVEFLLVKRAEVDPVGDGGLTPLHLAARRGHPKVVKRLLAFGADPAAKDARGRTPAQRASDKGVAKMLAAFAARKTPGTPRARGWLGIGFKTLATEVRRRLNITHGLELTRVVPDSPAGRAGLRAGDILLEIDGTRLDTSKRLVSRLAESRPGHVASLVVLRGGRRHGLTARLGVAPPDATATRPPIRTVRKHPKAGTPHPKHRHVLADGQGGWQAAPGYKWLTNKPGDLRVVAKVKWASYRTTRVGLKGLSFRCPATWTVKDVPNAVSIALIPPDVATRNGRPLEDIRVAGDPVAHLGVRRVEDRRVLSFMDSMVRKAAPGFRRVGTVAAVPMAKGRGIVADWELTGPRGVAVRARFFACIHGGQLVTLVATGPKDRIAARDPVLRRIFASYRF